eukprot:2820195-Alexandrium_andersonii.AAC.1
MCIRDRSKLDDSQKAIISLSGGCKRAGAALSFSANANLSHASADTDSVWMLQAECAVVQLRSECERAARASTS